MSWPKVPVDSADKSWPRKVAQAVNHLLGAVVLRDKTAEWAAATGTESRAALASYAGQTVSNPPTQAQMQATDDAVKAHSQRLVALINDLKANGTLT
jgi:hypothetical protein